jgi:hypothetical protein
MVVALLGVPATFVAAAAAFTGASAFFVATADFLTGGFSISFGIVRGGNRVARFGSDNEADMSSHDPVSLFSAPSNRSKQSVSTDNGHKAFNPSMRGRPVNSMDTCQ